MTTTTMHDNTHDHEHHHGPVCIPPTIKISV